MTNCCIDMYYIYIYIFYKYFFLTNLLRKHFLILYNNYTHISVAHASTVLAIIILIKVGGRGWLSV